MDNCPSTPNPDQCDTDTDGVGDECDAAPGNSCVEAEGSLTNNPKAKFKLEVEFELGEGPEGDVKYKDKIANQKLRSTKINNMLFCGNRATILGVGKANNVLVNFRADVTDNGGVDTFKIQWPGNMAVGGVQGDGVEIEPEACDDDDDDN